LRNWNVVRSFPGLRKKNYVKLLGNFFKMNYDPENIFAKILRGEIPCEKVFENNTSLAFKDINPQAPLHILVIPKGPYKSMDEFSKNATDKEIVGFIRAVGKVARDQGSVQDGYRILSNAGRDAHQEVPHFHVHIFSGRDLGRMIEK